MAKITSFEDLDCWKAAKDLTVAVYQLSLEGKLAADWTLKDQLKRATLSCMNNIAEGFARKNQSDFIRFLDYAQSSASEVKSMIFLMDELLYLEKHESIKLHQTTDSTRFQTLGLIKYLRTKTSTLTP